MNTSTAPARRARIGAALLFTALAFGLTPPAQAQWKWQDPSGKIQYSDRPPPVGTPDKDILQRPPGQELRVVQWQNGRVVDQAASAPAAPASAASKPGKAEVDAEAKRKAQEKEKLAQQKADEQRIAEQRRSNCASARDNERVLTSGQRVTRLNDQGENVYLDDQQRAAELERARTVIASECR